MNDKIKQLYDLYVSNGLIKSVDFNTFSSASEEQRSQLYNLGRDNGLFQTTDFNTFNSAFVGGQVNVPYARKEQVQEQVQQPTLKKKEPSSMVSSLETTPSVSQEEPLRTTDYINIEGEAEPKTATVPYAVGMEPKPKVEKVEKKKAPSFLTESISTITPELIAKNEEYVVPQLNYQFGPMGFKFEESGMTGDFMKVTAPNGEQIEISLDPFLSSKEKTESEKLKQFINKYTANIKGLSTLENQYKEENRKFNNQKEVDDAVKLNTDEANSIKNEISLFLQEQKKLDSESKYLQSVPFNERNSKEYLDRFNAYNTKISEIEIKKNDIQRRQKDLSYREGKLNSAIGRYTDMKSKQGTYLGGLWNSVLEGVGSQASGVASTILDIGSAITPSGALVGEYDNLQENIISVAKEKGIDAPKSGESFAEWSNRVGFYMKLSDEKRQEIIKEAEKRSTKKEVTEEELDKALKYTKKEMLPSIREGARIVFGDDDTTVEWSRAKEQGFWGGAILGLAKSAPAMIGGAGPIGWAQRTAMTFAQVSDDVDKEMSENPEFENISEKEKWFVKGPIGIAVGVLESIGFSNIVKNTGLLNKITMAALNKAGKKTSAKTFADLVKNEVDSMVARGLLTLTGAGLAEAETGALQEAATLGIKDIYNTVKDKEIFETPDFLSADYIKQVATAGAQEAIGGFVLGVPSSVSAAYRKKGFQGMDDVTFRTFEAAANDDNIQKAFVSNLKNNVVNGTMTTEEAKGILNDYRNSVKLFRALPDGLSTEQKKEAMNLLKERSEYESAIQGKDPAMVKPQQDKINSINERLNKISQDAIQEQTTGQVPVQPTNGVGEKVEERKPETGPEVVTAEGVSTEEKIKEIERRRQEELNAVSAEIEGMTEEELTKTAGDRISKRVNINKKYDDELASLTEAKEEVKPTVLANVDATTTALESVPVEEKMDLEFTQEDGTVSPVNGNERMLSDMYHKAVALPEDQRTEPQKQVVSLVEQSLSNDIEVERLERELAKPEVAEGPVTTVGISISNDTDIENLKNTARSKAQAARTESEKKSAEIKVRVLDVAQRAIKTLKSILPDFDIVIHDNENSYISEADKARVNRQSGGFFQYKVSPDGKMIGRIDINLSKANARTVAHEVTHAILTKSFGENVKLFNEFRKRLSKVLSSDKNKELNDFANRYIDEDTGELLDVNHEEFLAELTGMLEQQETKISVTTMQKIAALINEFVSKITGGKFTPFKDIKDTKDVVDFFNTVSGAIRKGEAISLKEREMDIVFETISKAQLTTEGTGILLSGNENVINGTNSPTVNLSTDKETKYSDDYTFEDIQSSDLQPSSRAVTLASKVGSGEISYKKQGETKSFVLPYLNKELSNKINRLREKYKSTKDKVQKEKIKKEINNLTKQIFTEFKNMMTQNLLALYDSLTPEFIEKSKQWYVGANRMANAIAKKYNLTVEQVSGIIGVLSPQKDWFNNVSAAERVVEIMSKYADKKITKDLIDKAVAYNSDKRTGEPNNWANVLLNVFSKYGEISINEAQSMGLSEDIQSTILRAFDQSLHSPRIPITDPNGKFIGYDTTPIRWNSNSEIATAISIFRDGSQKNIDIQLGNGNKVRNFYNNIVDPNSETPYVTADTHALSAALNSPISAEDAGGIGLFNGANEPMYALVKAAYIDAARIAGIKPREMQSITWEAQRIGINDKNRTENQKSETFNYIKESRTNNKTPYERASELIAKNRSANPSWGRTEGITTQRTSDEILKSARLQAKQRVSEVSSLRGQPGGGIGKPTTGVGKAVAGGKGVGEKIITKAQMVAVAPYFNTQVKTTADANNLRQDENYIKYKESLKEVATLLGFPNATINETIGGYQNDAGEKIVEISNKIDLKDATIEEAAEFAAMAAVIAPEVQESSIAFKYVKENSPSHNANEYVVKVEDLDKAVDALKVAGINNFSIDDNNKTISFINVFEFQDPKLEEKIINFVEELESKGVNYEQPKYKSIEFKYVDKGERKKILRRIESKGSERRRLGEDFRPYIESAIKRDAEFQKTTIDEYLRGRAGNRIFNEPLEGVNEIADRYYQRAFGKPRPKYKGTEELDRERAKRLSDAFIAMMHAPNDPKVRAAYDALVKETIEQYKAFLDAGYSVEINNTEPYRNSQEMIDDLRNNKRIKIFSTESGFGGEKITEKQRKDNPLLAETEFKDVNGEPLLVNDLFRAVHDFFGHAELGNGFGPKGEENAWNVHARMFSPLARKAMTTETRGQNSYVNFSEVNQEADKLREEARKLREEGKIDEANKISDRVVNMTQFAEQKIGLLPDEFTEVDLKDEGDLTRVISKASLTGKDINNVIKRGRAAGVSERAIRTVLKKQGFTDAEIDAAMGAEKGAAKKVTVSEEMLPGFNRMMEQVDGIVAKSRERGVSEDKVMENVMRYVEGSKAYENASDVQREQIIRDIEKRFGVKQKAAPKAEKIIGTIKDTKKVTMSEKDALVKQIKDQARGAKDAKSAMRRSLDFVSRTVKELARSGKISVKQAANVLRKFSSINPLSKESVDRFVDYMSKVFADADYSNKLSFALKTKSDISKLSKNKDKDANLRALGEKFAKIDPSMVENIDEYNEMASAIKESIKGSTYRREAVMPAQMVNIQNAMEYVNKAMDAQKKKMTEIKAAEIQEMMGVDVSDLSYDQMMQMLESKEPITKYNEGIIRGTIDKMFNVYSSIINQIIDSGIDPMTGDSVDIKTSKKMLVKKFMEMDLSILTPKEALQAVDALNNFLVNKSTAKMQTVLSNYTGEMMARRLNAKGVVAKTLKMYWSSSVGRFFGEQFTALPLLIERMFKGVIAGANVEKAMGLTELKNKKAEAENRSNRIVEEYINKFYKSKSNGEAFDTEANVTERGMAAFMSRSVTGTEEEMQQDFNRRKKLIEESIEALSKGSEKEQAKAKLYKQAYDKILKDSNSVEDVRRNTDKNNLAAIDFWVENWSSIYDELADVSENVYNKILDKDVNYTPDRFSRLERAKEKTELSNDESVFHGNTNSLYKKETGVLMRAERPESLPTDDKGKKPMMYIDLSFDMNNANSMYDAMVDINTAAPIRQIEAFVNSDAFDSLVPEVKDARILKERIQLYVRNIRGKNIFENDTFAMMMRKLNTISAIGVGQALGGILQPLKQTIPVAMNTLINAGGLDIGSVFSQSKMAFIDNSGYSIANRGIESQTQLKSINKLMDLAAESKGIKALKFIEKANKIWLDIFLVKPDVFVARASWMSYYEQSLKKQGIDPSGIDYSTHKLNKEAADYAQSMVDRQQNISDSDLQGKMFSSKKSLNQLFVKTLLPFANFRINQYMRLSSDVATLTSMTSSKEDRIIAARSLSGFGVEMATFSAISIGAAYLLGSLSKWLMGEEEDDEEEEKRLNNIIKGRVTGIVTDLISPLPIFDKPIAAGVNMGLDKVQDAMDIAKEDKLSIFGDTKTDMAKSLGTLGISIDRVSQLYELFKLSSDGEYTDDYGNKKKISDENMEYLQYMTGVALLTNIGLAPSEANTVVRNSVRDAKAQGKTEKTVEREQASESKVSEERSLLNELMQEETDDEVIDAINKRIGELDDTSEERKEKNKAKKEEKKKLLKGYESMSDMKRYNPELYEETFGKDSPYYEKYKDDMILDKKLNKLRRKIKDEEEEYVPQPRKRKKKEEGGFGSQKFGGKKFGEEGVRQSTFGTQRFGK